MSSRPRTFGFKSRHSIPDASVPTAYKNPLTLQNPDPLRRGPLVRATMGFINSHTALKTLLWIRSMMRLYITSVSFSTLVTTLRQDHKIHSLMTKGSPHLEEPVGRYHARHDTDRSSCEGQYLCDILLMRREDDCRFDRATKSTAYEITAAIIPDTTG